MSNLHFTPYIKIPEDSTQWGLSEKQWRALQKQTWIATEKVHGANFCLLCDGLQLRCAKRKVLLQKTDDFFAYQRVLTSLQSKIFSLFEELKEQDPALVQCALYGELCGGSYPHPEVTPIQGVEAVQTGVYYAPEVIFLAFDCALSIQSPQSDTLDTVFLSFAELKDMTRRHE
ncbi:MAG: RNA ligase family protein, partial [Myxococcota bacterium]